MVTHTDRPKRKQGAVTVLAHTYPVLPDSAYNLWVRGDLNEQMGYSPETRIEVIEGAIFVSPAPVYRHSIPIRDIERGLFRAEEADESFRWRHAQNVGFNLVGSQNGYIPDLVLIEADVEVELDDENATELLPGQVAMVVEVTSKSNAANDRAPSLGNPLYSKWRAYARAGVPYYLLVDRDPRFAGVTLFGEPVNERFTPLAAWAFGDQIVLPEPFGFVIDTARWKPW